MKLVLPYVYKLNPSLYLSTPTDDRCDEGDQIPYDVFDSLGIRILTPNSHWFTLDVIVYSTFYLDVADVGGTMFEDTDVVKEIDVPTVDKPDGWRSDFFQNRRVGGRNSLHSSFPFTTYDGEFHSNHGGKDVLRVAVVPQIRSSRSGVPDFFGTVKLHPIVQDYRIVGSSQGCT